MLACSILLSEIPVYAVSDMPIADESQEIETEEIEEIEEDATDLEEPQASEIVPDTSFETENIETDSEGFEILITEEVPPLKTGYFSENEQNYYADSNGTLQSGWIKLGDEWKYFDKEQGYIEIISETEDGYWYYLEDGRITYFDKKTTVVLDCWKTINNQKYYFDEDGFVVKGWHQDGTYWYFADETGQMQKGPYTVGEGEDAKNYYFDANYRLSSGWKKIDGIYRFFNYDENHENCYEIEFDTTTGWLTAVEDGRKCYIDAKGPAIGWRNLDGYRYHFDANGFMDTGLFQDGRYHYFAETEETATEESPLGNVAKGARKVGDIVYGFHASKYYRVTGWQTFDGNRYYFQDDYSAVTGWYKDGNYWYYAEPSAETEELQPTPEGAMAIGVKTITETNENGELIEKNYYFDSNYRLKTGWIKIDNEWRYFEKADKPEDCYEILTAKDEGWMNLADESGRISYVNSKNAIVKGWQTIDGYRYYFDAEGFLKTGWFEESGKKYYAETVDTFEADSPVGNIVRGVKVIDGITYVFHGKSYYTLKGWQTINGKKYYVNTDGSVHTGWYKEGNYWYYVDSECVRAKGEKIIAEANENGELIEKTYYFDNNYRLKSGWNKINNIWRYFEKSDIPEECYEINCISENGWMFFDDESGRKSYVNAKNNTLVKGWLTLDGVKYYFDADGFLKTGWFTVGAGKYYANENGVVEQQISGMKNTWWENEGHKYYFNSKGQLLKGFQTISKQRFYFNNDGILQTGWFEVNGKMYYGEPEQKEDGTLQGSLAKGAKTLSVDMEYGETATYVFHSSQYYRMSGFQNAGGNRYYLNPENDCRANFGWFEVKGKTYYGAPLSEDNKTLQGSLKKGAQEIVLNSETGETATYVFHSSQYYRLTGLQSSGGKRYYLQANGKARTGWFTIGTDLYYGEPETTEDGILKGTLAAGAKEIERVNGSKETYFFHTKSNYRLTGWQTVDKKRYYLKSNGTAQTGWFTLGGKIYYGEPETTEDGTLKGTIAVGAKKIDGKTYVFHSSKYYRVTGWQTVNKKKFYLKSNGIAQTGWFRVGKKWYYGEPETTENGILRGTLANGFKVIPVSEEEGSIERKYYFDSNCRLTTGWKTISKVRYFFQKDDSPWNCYLICEGPSRTGWFTFEGDKKSYLNSKGQFLTGWQSISKKKYYFNSEGIMQTGWCTISGKEYYFNSEGIYIPMTTPSLVSVTSTKYECADVKWKAVSGAKNYIVEYSKNKAFPSWNTQMVTVADASATETCVEGLSGNATYYFRVRYTVWNEDETASEITNSIYSAVKNVIVQGEIEPTADAAEVSECEIVSGSRDGGIMVKFKASLGIHRIKSVDDNYYIVETESYGADLDREEPVAVIEKIFDIDTNFEIGAGEAEAALMNKFALAIKNEDESYELISEPVGITNPEVISKNKAEMLRPVSKKGIQAVALNERRDDGSPKPTDDNAYGSNTKHTLFNIMLNDLIGTSEGNGFVPYEYKGKTYYFSNCAAEQETVRNLVAGYPQYIKPGVIATNKVAVTFVLLLQYDNDATYLIDPAARSKGHKYYTLNVREEEARETWEALFFYLGEIFGQEDCYVTHWVLGNEINSSKAWNYQGSLSFSNYIKSYASAFRLLYNGVKAGKTGNNVYVSLDNGWTAAPDTYSGKTTLDKFAEYAQEENKDMLWSIAYHGYSYPLTRNDFWNDSKNTTSSVNTKYISMKNIAVLTNYAATLEQKYEKPAGSIRVILSEQGYNGKSNAKSQAEALARGYYLAEFNDRIDAFIIRAIIDDEDETAGGLHLGIRDLGHDKRISYFVYEYMDSDLDYMKQLIPGNIVSYGNIKKFEDAQKILGGTNWEKIIPGFSREKLAAMH